MTTLREALQTEIATAKTELAAKEARLAALETTFADALARDIVELRGFIRSVGHHLFGVSPAAAPAPAPSAAPVEHVAV